MTNATNKKETLEILVSTMNRSSLSFLEAMFPGDNYLNYDLLIINQTTEDTLLKSDHENIRVINSFERGLSQSRNLAVENAAGSICLIADDDISYNSGFRDHVLRAFQQYPDADIVTFQMVDENEKLFRIYPSIEKHTKKTISTANSVVIAFRPHVLRSKNVRFNINFGLGGTFQIANEY
ncbi:MAG: glycosyltransferase family 2 protein, partial [Bacteroidia bacterium]|nr:glycosyltransferase family 2 protein [Bacteroidia bacterium]